MTERPASSMFLGKTITGMSIDGYSALLLQFSDGSAVRVMAEFLEKGFSSPILLCRQERK